MQQHKLNGALAIEVPRDIKLFEVEKTNNNKLLGFKNNRQCYFCETLPQGDWQFLSLSSDVTEEMASQIVEKHELPFSKNTFCYPDYEVYGKTGFKAFDTALESLRSWERANGYIQDVDCSNQWCDNGKIDVGYGEHTFCEVCGGSGSQQQVVNIAYLIKG